MLGKVFDHLIWDLKHQWSKLRIAAVDLLASLFAEGIDGYKSRVEMLVDLAAGGRRGFVSKDASGRQFFILHTPKVCECLW